MRFETVQVFGVNPHRREMPGVLPQLRVGPDALQDFMRVIAEDVVSKRINPVFLIKLFEPSQKTSRQVAVADAPLLNKPGFPVPRKMLVIVFGQTVGEPVVQTDIGLKVVVNTRTMHSIKNGVDMGLPLIRRLEISKG